MAEQDGYGGFSPATYGAPVPYVPAPPQVMAPTVPMMRPLSIGEILDRTFATYRGRFWLFVGIGTVPAIVLTLSSMLRFLYLAVTHQVDRIQPGNSAQVVAHAVSTIAVMQLYFLPATLLFLAAYGVSHAATVDAVYRVSQEMPVSAGIAYRAIGGRWLRWTGIVFRQFWSAAWPMLPGVVILFTAIGLTRRIGPAATAGAFMFAWIFLMSALVLSVINFVRNSLAVAAGVQENIGVNAAMRRSKALVAGRKGRIFLALLLLYVLQMVVGAVQVPLVFAATAARGAEHVVLQAVMLTIQFVTIALITPVASIMFTFFYIDERVRREGLDIELMMQRSFSQMPPPVTGAGF